MSSQELSKLLESDDKGAVDDVTIPIPEELEPTSIKKSICKCFGATGGVLSGLYVIFFIVIFLLFIFMPWD